MVYFAMWNRSISKYLELSKFSTEIVIVLNNLNFPFIWLEIYIKQIPVGVFKKYAH